MPADPRLMALPALRALAEREADAFHAAYDDPDWSDARTWRLTVDAHLTLLADLTRPASRDAVCRLVAAELWPSAEPLATAPRLYWTPEAHDTTDYDGAPNGDGWPAGWWLDRGDGHMQFFSADDWSPDPDGHTHIPGLPDGSDPTTALLTIALHVLTETP